MRYGKWLCAILLVCLVVGAQQACTHGGKKVTMKPESCCVLVECVGSEDKPHPGFMLISGVCQIPTFNSFKLEAIALDQREMEGVLSILAESWVDHLSSDVQGYVATYPCGEQIRYSVLGYDAAAVRTLRKIADVVANEKQKSIQHTIARIAFAAGE